MPLLIVVDLILLSIFLIAPKFQSVSYYGYLLKISGSGEARFRWFDVKANKIVDPENQYAWFWAMLAKVPENQNEIDRWVKFIEVNQQSVFKITGTKDKSDCDYYGKDKCIENIIVKSISVVGTNKTIAY